METIKREFAIEFKRVSYVTVYVAAESQDKAESMAWAEIDQGYARGNDAEWTINSLDQVTT